jgi:hypothetical protein
MIKEAARGEPPIFIKEFPNPPRLSKISGSVPLLLKGE